MYSLFEFLFFYALWGQCVIGFHEQYRVPHKFSGDVESYVFNDREYLLQNFPVNWENAKILCKGHYNGSLATLDTKEKAEFIAEVLSESQFSIESVWLGARRASAEDPEGYRWGHGLELRRTALDVLNEEGDFAKHYPLWLNRTHVPVPEGGADCVALERAYHDKPVFVDLPCALERPFVCEKEAREELKVTELKTVRCRTGVYRVFDGRLDWHEAAAYCVLRKMALANIGTMRCLKKLGLTMLKTRPSIENAWVGARGSLGVWRWTDSGRGLLSAPPYCDVPAGQWPPVRDRNSMKSDGCLQLDRHSDHPPVFLEARCERKMQFICYQKTLNFAGAPALRMSPSLPSDDNYYYLLVRELYEWQRAYDNCNKINGTLAFVDTNDIMIQLLLVMGENKDEPIDHLWIAGKLNMSRDPVTDDRAITWSNPANHKRIPDSKNAADIGAGAGGGYIPPWLNEDFSMDSPCLNLDRQDHLNGLLYGLPCDTPQASICMIEKGAYTSKIPVAPSNVIEFTTPADLSVKNVTVGHEDNLENLDITEKTIEDGNIENKQTEKNVLLVKGMKYGGLDVKDKLNGVLDKSYIDKTQSSEKINTEEIAKTQSLTQWPY